MRNRLRTRIFTPALALLLGAGTLTACAPAHEGPSGTDPDHIAVVASTNVYGDIVEKIGGDHVRVESIINRISQDPHSYEATAQDRLKVSKAQLVVLNGGGYDTFMDSMTKASATPAENILNAVDLSGLKDQGESPAAAADDSHAHAHGEFNEHVWYSMDAMDKLAAAVEQKLSALAPASSAEFRSNAEAFRKRLAQFSQSLQTAGRGKHVHVAMTEPVPGYLLEKAGYVNVTPEAFATAVEEGHDVPASVLDETLKLFSKGTASALAYNEQTTGPQTDAVKSAAQQAGATIMSFTETLPEGKDYLGWMAENVATVESAQAKGH